MLYRFETGPVEYLPDLGGFPADLVNPLLMPEPCLALFKEQFNVAPRPVRGGVVPVAHHQHNSGLFQPDVSAPVGSKTSGVVYVEIEVPARTQGSVGRPRCIVKIRRLLQVIHGIAFAGNQVHLLWQGKILKVAAQHAQPDIFAASLLASHTAHERRSVEGVHAYPEFCQLDRRTPGATGCIARDSDVREHTLKQLRPSVVEGLAKTGEEVIVVAGEPVVLNSGRHG